MVWLFERMDWFYAKRARAFGPDFGWGVYGNFQSPLDVRSGEVVFNYVWTAKIANFCKIRLLGWSARLTSLFAKATGIKAESYISQCNASTLARTLWKFAKSLSTGLALISRHGIETTCICPLTVLKITL